MAGVSHPTPAQDRYLPQSRELMMGTGPCSHQEDMEVPMQQRFGGCGGELLCCKTSTAQGKD